MTSISQKTIKNTTNHPINIKNKIFTNSAQKQDDLNVMVEGDFDEYSVIQVNEKKLQFPSSKNQINRVIILQSLFEIDLNGNDYEKVIQRVSNNHDLESKTLANILNYLKKITENLKTLDMKIQTLATEFPTFQIAVIDRNILRLGLVEIVEIFNDSKKINSIIEEFSKLAFIFGGENSDRFIKGVLKSFIQEKVNLNKRSNNGFSL